MFEKVQMTPRFVLCVIGTDLFSLIIDKSAAPTEIYMYMKFLTVRSILKRNGFNLPR